MSIIKKKIRFTGNDLNIQFPVEKDLEYTGYQQEIDDYTNIKTANSINDATDGEVSKFSLDNEYANRYLAFEFSNNDGTLWRPNYNFVGFSDNEITAESLSFLNSFYIMDFFDSTSPIEQTKIFSAYITNLNVSRIQQRSYPQSEYQFNDEFQLFELQIPLGYLNISNNDTYTGHSRFTFYNGKTGEIIVFFNKDYESKTTPDRMFFKTELDLQNKTWRFLTPSFQDVSNSTMYAKQLINSEEYIERFNDTFENFENLQQNYPDGNAFNYENGQYYTPES